MANINMATDGYYVFPYNKVPQGSKIIIYGAGYVGHSFYSQMVSTKYCQVLAVTDRGYNEEADADRIYTYIAPTEIYKYNFDYVVVSVENEGVSNRIKTYLSEELGISNEKIITGIWPKVRNCFSLKSLEKLSSVEAIITEIHFFQRMATGDLSYFDTMKEEFQELKLTDKNKSREIVLLFNEAIKLVDDIKKIILLRILFKFEEFTADNMRDYLEVISRVESPDSALHLLMDAAVIERNVPSARYPQYYNDKRAISERIVLQYMPWVRNAKPIENRDNDIVAIVMSTMSDSNDSHTIEVVIFANELVKQGKKVFIFPMDLFRYRYGETFCKTIVNREFKSSRRRKNHKEMLSDAVELIYNEEEEMKGRALFVINRLKELKPGFVLDMCGEYSFLSPAFAKMFPVIHIPMRGYASSGVFDIYLSRIKSVCIEENKIYHSMDENQIFEKVFTSNRKTNGGYKRETYDFGDKDFIFTTVGYRLHYELTEDFVDLVCSFLEKYSHARWILVGGDLPYYLCNKYKHLFDNRQIIDWGYEDNLAAFMGLCDAYWNPSRTGAGGSIMAAVRGGVPVVMTDYPSDALSVIGVENAVRTQEECYNEMCRLLEDEDYRIFKTKELEKALEGKSYSEYIATVIRIAGEIKK